MSWDDPNWALAKSFKDDPARSLPSECKLNTKVQVIVSRVVWAWWWLWGGGDRDGVIALQCWLTLLFYTTLVRMRLGSQQATIFLVTQLHNIWMYIFTYPAPLIVYGHSFNGLIFSVKLYSFCEKLFGWPLGHKLGGYHLILRTIVIGKRQSIAKRPFPPPSGLCFIYLLVLLELNVNGHLWTTDQDHPLDRRRERAPFQLAIHKRHNQLAREDDPELAVRHCLESPTAATFVLDESPWGRWWCELWIPGLSL